MKEVVIIFKSTKEMAETLKTEAKARKVTKSELIRACISKYLKVKQKDII